jgi:septal ring factor EnvC (AmiA/AmiB activator)
MLVYYDYFNRARSERIATVSAEVGKLRELGSETNRVAAELSELEAAQATQAAALAQARNERKAAVAKVETGIASSTAAMTKLRTDEKRLAELVVQLAEVMAGFPVDTEQPFGKLKGKLAWPVQGRIAGDYGQPRAGGPVKWSGVLLEASQGTPVRAVYRGRVVFADWLPGLGLLIILDHGGGYMSLYGHNEALLKEPGDSVEAGEPVAQVGDTGGQSRPALYFEIRQNGEPLNPHPWIANKPPAR